MNTYPLVRVRWSNEHVMAALFLVVLLYHIPGWVEHPAGIFTLIVLIAEGLLLDTLINALRYKRLWCSVSAAVTAAMLSVLSTDVPLWGRMLGVAVALVLGKHLWGGTGRNKINPAMTGILFLIVCFEVELPFFPASYLLLPAVLLSLPFLTVRIYAGLGYLVGIIAAFLMNGDLSILNLLSYGGLFFACLVVTDPVTVTNLPLTGSVAGFFTGFIALLYPNAPILSVLGILLLNLITWLTDVLITRESILHKPKLRINKAVPYRDGQIPYHDLSNEARTSEGKTENISADIVLNRIKINEVFGMGGAAFPTYRKLMTALSSSAEQKHLIINGVECDPGLIHDNWLLRNHPKEIIKGLELLKKCITFSSVHLAVKDTVGLSYQNTVQIYQVPDYYPAGAEKILIHEVLKQKISFDQIPAEHGILVLNAQTLYSIWEAVACNKKADTRFLTVCDLKNKEASVVKVKLGMKLREIMEAVYPGNSNVFAGGGIMQSSLTEEDAVIDQMINYIVAAKFPRYKESPQCSRCGSCSKNCPVGLKVYRIAELVDLGKVGETDRYHVKECISCGSCSYSCPAGRNLSGRVKKAKEVIR